MHGRPESVAEIAQRAVEKSQPFDYAVREFLDAWQSMSSQDKVRAISDEPDHVGRVQDAYLAALAEHLAVPEGLDLPSWSQAQERFLKEPFFAGGLESLKALLIVESPAAVRRRLIFISADGLSRPRRKFIEENAVNVQNLDV